VGLRRLGDTPRYLLTLDDRVIEVLVETEPGAFNVQIGGRTYEVDTLRRRQRRRRDEGDQFVNGVWVLRAPLTGIVQELRVAVGDSVAAGDVRLNIY
jgi:acetyl/propionyl-CoA carboxylase alpha subunit